ncbi:hypothetical protein, unlikely [Trypanosoma brucei gambiense DAL972]|uniref:Uncharacterized protein n=1 Tax=Trypanosoma brucei gambiense (strain MHOM/CI/86/DAL972) TaxID=679716 RepID=D0AAQ7_TRYB9|nr:hypothetical protein, unlikely [Trypanosoma brucei gambiense DAL972]CBH18758.1 hypothetical protein, unlikely [Trypanosoma brucei gambiense DAL972]|eukprot:XP_011781022.1 hypothetical protein, unlikely [Trypanosoma brucei gambiense DAL972]
MTMINGGTGLKHELNLIEVMVFEGSFFYYYFMFKEFFSFRLARYPSSYLKSSCCSPAGVSSAPPFRVVLYFNLISCCPFFFYNHLRLILCQVDTFFFFLSYVYHVNYISHCALLTGSPRWSTAGIIDEINDYLNCVWTRCVFVPLGLPVVVLPNYTTA